MEKKAKKGEYPFVFLGHGELYPDAIGKNEEVFIWFKREVNKDEQMKIMEGCPGPIDFVSCWGKEFVYFGSGGDTYDYDIIKTYAVKEGNNLEESFDDEGSSEYDDSEFDNSFQSGLEKSLPLFFADLESWINKVNQIAPIAFLRGPYGAKADDWGVWSDKNAYNTAMQYCKNYRNKYPGIFKDNKNDEARYFGYIYDFIMGYAKSSGDINIDEFINDLEFAYDLDGITKYFGRLNTEDGNLQRNANKLYELLKKLSPAKRVEKINKLKPYTQFAYYASYAAIKNKDLLENTNLVEFLKKLIIKLPAERKDIIGTFLQFIGENLVNAGPGFSEKNNRKHAGLAAEILELALDYNVKEDAYINCARFYNWEINYEAMLRVSLKGVNKYPENQTIIANILFSADKAGKPELAKDYINIKSDDPLVIANQSYSLVSSGKVKEAHELLINHYNKNGAFDVNSFNNFLYTCTNYEMPEDKTVAKIIDKAIENLKESKEYINHDFAVNLTILLNNSKNYEKTIEIFKLYEQLGGDFPNASLYCNCTYAAAMSKDKKIIKSLLDVIIPKYSKTPMFFTADKMNSHIILGNIACLYAFLKDKTKMLGFLRETKKVHPDFKKLKEDEDFKEYWDDPDFRKLFE